MVKNSKKTRVEVYDSKDIVCDLCEQEIPEGHTLISIIPAVAMASGARTTAEESDRIDICSVDCLVENAAAAGLILNTKILPEVSSRKKPGAAGDLLDYLNDQRKYAYEHAKNKPNDWGK